MGVRIDLLPFLTQVAVGKRSRVPPGFLEDLAEIHGARLS